MTVLFIVILAIVILALIVCIYALLSTAEPVLLAPADKTPPPSYQEAISETIINDTTAV